jgi:hypothetical protein
MKKTLYIASIAAGIAIAATALIAGAQTVTTTASPSQPVILQVGPAGKVLMRGTVASVASGVITVNSWGGTWIVNVGASAQILPAAAGTDITQFKAGDFVGVQGTVSRSATWTIDATLVRDWTYRAAVTQERQQNIQSAQNTMRSGEPKNYVGVSSNMNGSSFTLTVDGTVYAVNVAAGAEVVNENWITLPLVSISNGDNVRIWGVNASGTITAQIVRDVSVSATSTKR